MEALRLIIMIIPIIGLAQKGHRKHHKKNCEHHNKYSDNKHMSKLIVINSSPMLVNYKREKNRGSSTSWIPANGYKHRHIFFPEHQCYYDAYTGYYIYRNDFVWKKTLFKPNFITNISVAKKVELEIDHISNPYLYFDQHINLYH